MTFKRWIENILYKRVRHSHDQILNNQIRKGAEKYPDPLPGTWTARQLIRHAKEENVDQFVYLEATEIVVEQMEMEIDVLKDQLAAATQRAEKAEKELKDILIAAERERVKWANLGR
jgi:hypothetical protein